MKIRTLVFGLSILIFGGCTKEDDAPAVESKGLELVYPVNLQDLNPCCINFQWNNPEAGNSRILIAKDANFNELILDSSLVSNSLTLKKELQSDTEYFWKVSNSNSESVSSFKIKDVISGLKPTYNNVKIHRYTWNTINGFSNDTTYFSTFKLIKEGDKVRFMHTVETYDFNLLLSPRNVPFQFSQGAYAEYYAYNFSRGCTMRIDFLTDSIYIDNKTGGLGGYIAWEMKFKK